MELRIKILRILVFLLFLIWITFLFSSCEREKAVFYPPELGELKVTYKTDKSVEVECSIIETGNLEIIEKGFCWCPKNDSTQICYIKLSIQDPFSSIVSELDKDAYYNISAYAKNLSGTTYSKALVMNGRTCVDLGLPSGTIWATCNIGASRPEDYGDYYAWGETQIKDIYTWESYIYAEGTTDDNPGITKYSNNYNIDTLTILDSNDDVASMNWGKCWRIPTYDKFVELIDKCSALWINQNGVFGYLFIGTNGNTIFFPAAGYRNSDGLVSGQGRYWSCSLYQERPRSAGYFWFDSSGYKAQNYYRYLGLSVRAVCNYR